MIDLVANSIRARRYRYANEDELQEGIFRVLRADGFLAEREVRLGARDRIDLLVRLVAAGNVSCTVGVEVKVDGQSAAVLRQLRRYAAHAALDRLVLVTTVARHLQLPDVVDGKPLTTVSLLDGGL